MLSKKKIFYTVKLIEEAPELVLGDVDEAEVAQAVAKLGVVDASRVVLVHGLEEVAHKRAPICLLRLEQKRSYQVYAHCVCVCVCVCVGW